jgi:hypothetical protein
MVPRLRQSKWTATTGVVISNRRRLGVSAA